MLSKIFPNLPKILSPFISHQGTAPPTPAQRTTHLAGSKPTSPPNRPYLPNSVVHLFSAWKNTWPPKPTYPNTGTLVVGDLQIEVRCGEYPIPENYRYLEIPIPEFPQNSAYTYDLKGDVYVREDQWEVAQFVVLWELGKARRGGFFIQYREGVGKIDREVLKLNKLARSSGHP